MTPDWIFVCALAKVFHIEDQGNELSSILKAFLSVA